MLDNNITDAYLAKHPQWQEGLKLLRSLLNETELEECIKWGMPVYTLNHKNVVGLAAFKNHFGLWFFKGSLLPDPNALLVNAQNGKTKAMRNIYLKDVNQINIAQIKKYLKAAITTEKSGLKIKVNRRQLILPSMLSEAFEQEEALGKAFGAMRMGDQIDFAEYITNAKRQDTKERRLMKIIEMIRRGEALHDRYR